MIHFSWCLFLVSAEAAPAKTTPVASSIYIDPLSRAQADYKARCSKRDERENRAVRRRQEMLARFTN